MIIENTFDKSKLISELKEIHIELVEVYKKIFTYKYHISEVFKDFIDKEYRENGISSKESQAWNDNFCHRASYTLLNKILFIRICEDKGFMLNPEDYVAGEPKDLHIGKKLSRIGLQKWANLVTNYTLGELVKLAFLDMKKSYSNIALYKEDKYEMLTPTTEELSLKYLDGDEEAQKLILQFENALSNIVEKLDTNNYNFHYTDGNILGDVYEKFMDRETRKAIGQFYTPEFVIEYILNNTVAEADVVENPFVSVADISCGSGHFLIMAYDILREKFINNLELLRNKYSNELYTIKKNGKEEELTGRDYWKEEHIHYHLLKHCIYGADIDSFAVQLTTINLLLKDLDNFTDELNIIECDSLIKWEEDYNWKDISRQLQEKYETLEISQVNLLGEEQKVMVNQVRDRFDIRYTDISGTNKIEIVDRAKAQEIVNLCEFWNRKFDYIVGNPPYGGTISKKQKDYYKSKYSDVHVRTPDVYNFFISRASKLIIKNFSFIIPSTILTQHELFKTRRMLVEKFCLRKVVNMGENVFEDNSYPTSIIIVDSQNSNIDVKMLDVSMLSNNYEKEIYINAPKTKWIEVDYELILNSIEDYKFLFIDKETFKLISKIKENKKTLEEITDFIAIGVTTGNDGVFKLNRNEIDRHKIEIDLLKPVLSGSNIGVYQIDFTGEYLLYIPREKRIGNYPNAVEYLKKNQEILSARSEAKTGQHPWYSLQRQRQKEQFENSKIVCRQTGDSLIAAVDTNGFYNINSVIDIVINESFKDVIDEYYITCLLNSNLMNYYYKTVVQEDGKLYAEIKPVVLKKLPIKIPDNKILLEIRKCVKEVMEDKKRIRLLQLNIEGNILEDYFCLVEEIYELKSRIYENIYNLNNYIYNIYDLTNEEVSKVEEKLNCKKVEFDEIVLNQAEFYNDFINNNKSLEEISNKWKCSYKILNEYRKETLKKIDQNNRKFYYKFDLLFKILDEHLVKKSVEILSKDNKYIALDILCMELKVSVKNFENIIEVKRVEDHTKKTIDIIKAILNTDASTWNAYRKAKKNNKINKTFIKYYDSKFYGLAEWSDEIHKNYFLDAIEEYTVNNPNEKKAKDILKLFKDLDIEDKQDYIEVIEEKIRKTFK